MSWRPVPTIDFRPVRGCRQLGYSLLPDNPRSPGHVALSPPSQAFARWGLASLRRSRRASWECLKNATKPGGTSGHKQRAGQVKVANDWWGGAGRF